MTHRIGHLERRGLIERLPDPHDGRGLLVELTSAGVAIVDRVATAHLTNERALLAALTEGGQAQLADQLRTMLGAFERDQRTPPAVGRGGRTKLDAGQGPATGRERT